MVNILDRRRRIRQVPGQLMPETTILIIADGKRYKYIILAIEC